MSRAGEGPGPGLHRPVSEGGPDGGHEVPANAVWFAVASPG